MIAIIDHELIGHRIQRIKHKIELNKKPSQGQLSNGTFIQTISILIEALQLTESCA